MKNGLRTICLTLALFLGWGGMLFAESYTCTTEINAYDPADPGKLIGQFQPGSDLEIGPEAAPGFHHVTFHSGEGEVIVALCQDADIGKAPAQEVVPEKPPEKDPVVENGPAKPLRVLFIGNSFTDAHKIPFQVQQLAAAAKEPRTMEAVMQTRPSYTLKRHLDEKDASNKIREGKWDYVVLQENSHEPFTNINQMKESIRAFDSLVHHAGAKTVLYMTWADKGEMQKQSILTHAYRACASAHNALLAPVGVAWERICSEKQPIDLYADDKHHPNEAGSYLSACVFYALFYGKSPEGLPGHLKDPENPGENLNTVFPADATRLQKAAWDAVQGGK